jgi:hypothetical protein
VQGVNKGRERRKIVAIALSGQLGGVIVGASDAGWCQ